MIKAYFLFLILFLLPVRGHKFQPSFFIVWNVGQGAWNTLVTNKSCFHFDIGGEKMDWKLIMRYCYNKENSVILSHGDWDHISFITQARYKLRKLCLHKWPKEKLSSSKKKTLTPIPKCHKSLPANIFEIHFPQKSKRPNYLSRVYIVNNKILIPGDSPKKMERVWLQKLKYTQKIQWLIAGHHGSETSSGSQLLLHLHHLRSVVISARKKKYGHPHTKTLERFKKKRLSILRTESLGHIKINLN